MTGPADDIERTTAPLFGTLENPPRKVPHIDVLERELPRARREDTAPVEHPSQPPGEPGHVLVRPQNETRSHEQSPVTEHGGGGPFPARLAFPLTPSFGVGGRRYAGGILGGAISERSPLHGSTGDVEGVP